MKICKKYTAKRVNKDFIKFAFVCECGSSYSQIIKDSGYDLRNTSHKHLAALEAFHELTEKGFHILNNF